MPMSSNLPRIKGIESRPYQQTVFESGTPAQSAVDPASGGGNATVIIPGQVNIGEQVRLAPASSALADILSGAGSALTGGAQLWGAIEQKNSMNAIEKLQRDYYDRVSDGFDPKRLDLWLDDQGFKPDRWNRDAFARFRASIRGMSISQWEQEDLSQSQVKFAQAIANDPVKMSTSGQQIYLTDLAKTSGNKETIKWANSTIASLNMAQANNALAVARMTQAQYWNKNLVEQLGENEVAYHTLANHPESTSLAMGIQSGIIKWDNDSAQFVNEFDGHPITPTTSKIELDAMLGISNPGIAEDAETYQLFLKSAGSAVDVARSKSVALDAKARLKAAELADSQAHTIPLEDYVRLRMNSPEFDALKVFPFDSEQTKTDKRIAANTILQDSIRLRTQQILKSNSEKPLAARIDMALSNLEIPKMSEFSHLFELDRKGNVIPNGAGTELLASVRTDLNNMVYGAVADDTAQKLDGIETLAKSGHPDALGLATQANGLTARAIREITGKEPTIEDGIVSFDERQDLTTARGKAMFQVRQSYLKALTEVNKNGQQWRIINDPLNATTGEVREAATNMIDNRSGYVKDIYDSIDGNLNAPALFYSAENFAKFLVSHGPNTTVPPKAVEMVLDLYSDETNQKSLLAGTAILSQLQGTTAATDIMAKMNPKQRLMALASLDGYASEAVKIQAMSYADAMNSTDPKTREQATILTDRLLERFVTPVRELMSSMSSVDATLIAQTAQKFGNLGDEDQAKYEDPAIQHFYTNNVPNMLSALGSSGLPMFSENPNVALTAMSADPTTRPLVEELLARTLVMSQKTPNEPITEVEWKQIFHMTFGGAQVFYPRGGGIERLFDPGRHFEADIAQKLSHNWNASLQDIDPDSFTAIKSVRESFVNLINEQRQERNLPPAEFKMTDPLDTYVTTYAQSVMPWAPGRTAKLSIATNSEVQAQLMDTTNPGVPLMIEIYDGDSFAGVLPITGIRSGRPGLVASRLWLPLSVPKVIKDFETFNFTPLSITP
jgi:hypothetical protein